MNSSREATKGQVRPEFQAVGACGITKIAFCVTFFFHTSFGTDNNGTLLPLSCADLLVF